MWDIRVASFVDSIEISFLFLCFWLADERILGAS